MSYLRWGVVVPPPSLSALTQPNITMEEFKAINRLREDQSRVVLIADKGVAMVIMDKNNYTDKALSLLADSNTYRAITKDPINKLKNKIIGVLKDIKQAGGLKDSTDHKMYPTSAVPSKLYGLPEIHKVGTPLRPILSSRNSITYGVAKKLAGIIHHLVGQSPHHFKKYPAFFLTNPTGKIGTRGNHHILWCQDPFHLCSSGPLNKHGST